MNLVYYEASEPPYRVGGVMFVCIGSLGYRSSGLACMRLRIVGYRGLDLSNAVHIS